MPAAPVVVRTDLRKNPDGTLRTTNRFGDYNPAPATLTADLNLFAAALGSLVGFQTGAGTFSLDLRGAWMGGSEASTCTFGVRTITGDSVATHNWAVTGSIFSQTRVTGSKGAGTLEVYALDSGGFQLSLGQYSWSVVDPPGTTDALAPTIPTGLAVTGATGALNLSFDPASDRFDGSIAASGLDHYRVFLDGVFNKNIAASNNPAQQQTVTSIGGSSPAASASQSNGVWTLTAAGAGIHNNTAEECLFVGSQLAGDATLIVKLDAFTSAYQYSTSGIMVRETLSQGAIFGAVYVQPSTPANGAQVKARVVTGGKGLNVNSASGTTSSYAKLERIGSNVIASLSSDGNVWTDIATMSLPMASNAFWGIFLSSQNPGVPCTSTIREVNFNELVQVTGSVTTSGTHSIQVSAVDVHGNESAKCAAVSGTATASVATAAPTKLSGGAWWILDVGASRDAQFALLSTIKSQSPLSTGVIVFWQLAELINPNDRTDYSGNWKAAGQAGFQLIDRFVNECTRLGLKFGLHIYTFGGGGTAGAQTTYRPTVCPLFMNQSEFGPNTPTVNGRYGSEWINANASFGSQTSVKSFVCWWEPPTMGIFNEWGRNMALRYDNNDTFEQLSFNDESTIPGITGWTPSAAKAALCGLTGMFATQRGYWKKSQLCWMDNYVNGDADMDFIQREAIKYFWTTGGPDTAADQDDPSHVNPNNSYSAFRNQSGDYVWMGRGSSSTTRNVPNPNYLNKVGLGVRRAFVEPEDLTANTPSGQRSIGDGWVPHGIAHANKLQCAMIIFIWNTYAGPNYNQVNKGHPSLVDMVNSMLNGGATVNGATAGVTLQYSGVRPSSWQ